MDETTSDPKSTPDVPVVLHPAHKTLASVLWHFLHTAPGMLLLGAIVTTGGGTWLNFVVQGRSQQKQRQFEIFKIMLEDSRALQTQLLTLANRRFYALRTMRARLDNDEYPIADVQEYWDEKVRPLREEWNENLLLFHGRLKLLFQEEESGPLAEIHLAALFYSEDEAELKAPPLDMAAQDLGTDRMPKTVHGSFVVTQRLVSQLLKDCKERGREQCLSEARTKTIRGYLDYLGKKISVLSDGLTTRLLYMPYGTVRAE